MKYLIILLVLSSCAITKAKHTQAVDSVHVIKGDSGAVKKNTNAEKSNADWERQIVLFNPKDTTIIKNNYITIPGQSQAIDYGAIAAIINEKGSRSKEINNVNYDSTWKQKYDSLRATIHEATKEKKEQALNIWQIIAIAAGVAIVIVIISKLKLSFKWL